MAVCATAAPSRADAETPTDLRALVSCVGGDCTVRIQLVSNGQLLLSPPLPFSTSSADVRQIEADEGLGHVAPGDPFRPLTAWSVGRDEHGITVGVEIIEALPGRYALLAHQAGGYDHVKRAHVALDVGPEALVIVANFIEGAGPGTIVVTPEPGGLVVLRREPDGSRSMERRRWIAGSAGLELRLVQ